MQGVLTEFPQHCDTQYLTQFSKQLFFITHDIRTQSHIQETYSLKGH